VRKGLIGAPQLAVMGSLGGLWSPDKVVADTPWRHNKLEGGGGGSIDIGVHQFHFLRYVFGEVAWISAVARTLEPVRYRRDDAGNVTQAIGASVDDTVLAVAGFENDAIGQVLWSWALHGEELAIPGAPALYGSEGSIRAGHLVSKAGTRVPLMEYFNEHLSAGEREAFFPMGLTDGFAIAQLDWLQAIAAKRDPETSGREGLHDLACAFGMLESSTARRQVTLNEVLRGDANAYQAEIDEYYGL
jgi:predicted dehydrogenase